MKRSFLLMALVAIPLIASAQEPEVEYNQYGQMVTSLPVDAKLQDGILVFQNKQSDYKIWFDVRVQGDAAVFFGQDEDYDKIGNGMSFRRTRFAVKAQLNKNWYAEFDTDWTSGTPELKDAILEYTGLKNFELTMGNFKENFSIQRNNTSRYLVFMERPMVTGLAPSRHLGINATYHTPFLWTAAGIFGPEIGGSEEMTFMEDNNKNLGANVGLSYTGKVVMRPLYKSTTSSLHLGAAYSYRNPKTTSTDTYGTARYSARNSTSINRKKYLDTDEIKGLDHETAWTVELAGHWKGLRYETAYIARTAHLDQTINPLPSQTADGWYAQASYLILGGKQNYDSDGAKYTRINGGRKWGDIELCGRYDYANFNTGNYFGGSAESYAFGVNFYLNNNIKFVVNYQYNNNDRYANGKGKLYVGHDASGKPTKDFTKVVESNGKAGVDYHMLACRFQVAF